ncbi:radical SAM protein [Nocardiopsis dassonvillei]|uniref:radical SAM protein n=1 Tax=Nocardiopsis dassonvillei TaxID=2014 RepID=UPI00200EBC4C|nr:radical SAM protein [Nocardiopsis dassonvillei]MCK9869385.1 radical SAM protein [Nocardiopsis dassonvillei]
MTELIAGTRLSVGPRALETMPADQQAGLDPYMAQIITNRKSGLSLNHIIGCPLDCGYCVRHFWGNFEQKTPQLLVSTREAVEMLTGHEAFRAHSTPIQLFNKATDPMLPGVKPHTFAVLEELDRRGMTNLVLVITRFHVSRADMERFEALEHVRVTLLFTYSGITDDRVEPIAKSATTVRAIETAAAHRKKTGVILYWRPITPGWNDDPDTMRAVLDVAHRAQVDALVFTGYYHKQENAEHLRGVGVEVPYEDDYQRRKVLPGELDAKVVRAWRDHGTNVPLFRKTSCGVTYAHQVPDYNGHWGVRELCDICPAAQRQLCADAHRAPTEDEFRGLLDEFGYDTDAPFLVEDGHVLTHALGEQRRYALQHALGYQIWEVDHPHAPGAHGRTLRGYTLSEDEQRQLDDARERLAAAARHDDD